MVGNVCFVNPSRIIAPVPVGNATVSTALPRNFGPMQWTVFVREGPDVGTAKLPSNELTKFAAHVEKASVKAACADTN